MLERPSLSPRGPIHRMAKAARWISRDKYGRPPKKLKSAASGTRFTDWIGGVADTLQVWFPAHWTLLVLHQLQPKEDECRASNPSWMDQDDVPDDIRKQWQETRANRTTQSKVDDFKDNNILSKRIGYSYEKLQARVCGDAGQAIAGLFFSPVLVAL